MMPLKICTKVELEKKTGDLLYATGTCAECCMRVSQEAEVVHICPSYRVSTVAQIHMEYCLCQDD